MTTGFKMVWLFWVAVSCVMQQQQQQLGCCVVASAIWHPPSKLLHTSSSTSSNKQTNVFEKTPVLQLGDAKIEKVLSIRGGKSSPSFLQAIISWFKDLLGLAPKNHKNKKTNKRYGNKSEKTSGGSAEKTSKSTESSKKASTMPPKKGTETTGRLQREIQSFMKNPPHNCKLSVDPKNIRSWTVTLTGVEGTVYAGEEYKLKMDFSKDYPAKPPSVYFLKPVPKHMHVYSNGDICLNLLGRDWRPTMTAESLAISILSMLSSAKEKTIPQDNAMHADAPPGRQQDNWMYHDDRC